MALAMARFMGTISKHRKTPAKEEGPNCHQSRVKVTTNWNGNDHAAWALEANPVTLSTSVLIRLITWIIDKIHNNHIFSEIMLIYRKKRCSILGKRNLKDVSIIIQWSTKIIVIFCSATRKILKEELIDTHLIIGFLLFFMTWTTLFHKLLKCELLSLRHS